MFGNVFFHDSRSSAERNLISAKSLKVSSGAWDP